MKVVVTMFERGENTGDAHGEFQLWVEREKLDTALAAIHTRETLPFLATLLTSSDSEERMKGVFGLSSFANGCPSQTPANVASMGYLQFSNPSPYRTPATIANFGFLSAPTVQEGQLVSFWLSWWAGQADLH